MPPPEQLDEFELIETLLAPLASAAPGAFGLTDDAAVVPPHHGAELTVTTDVMVSGVHYLPDDPPDDIGRKLLRVNLSDLAAMGAVPEAYLLTLALKETTTRSWIGAFVAGLADDQAKFGVSLIGGDTVRTPGENTLSLTAMGWARRGQVIRRRGAEPGHDIYVSGSIGDAALGLAVINGSLSLDAASAVYVVERLRRPEPRLALGQGLAGLISAGLDVSDGLVADLGHLGAVSGVAAVIQAQDVPLSAVGAAQVTNDQELLIRLITGGEDYELVFTVPPANTGAVERLGRQLALRLTKIGSISAGQGVHVIDHAGHELAVGQAGYAHFSA